MLRMIQKLWKELQPQGDLMDYCVFYKNNFGENRVDIIEANRYTVHDIVKTRLELGKYNEVHGYAQYERITKSIKNGNIKTH